MLFFLLSGRLPFVAATVKADASEDGASAADCTELFEGYLLAEAEADYIYYLSITCIHDGEVPGNGRVQLCIRGVHTFVRFTDEGCFQHLTWRGRYHSEDHAASYEKKACPLAASGNRNRLGRQLLQWYRAHALGCFGRRIIRHRGCPTFQAPGAHGSVEAALWRSQQYLHPNVWSSDDVPPFSMSDVAQACLVGSPNHFDWRREKLLDWVRLGSCGKVAGSIKLSENSSSCACSELWSVWCRGPSAVRFAHGSTPFSNTAFADETCWCDGGHREEPNWPSWLEASHLCTTFLQLPLLWDGIGFDKDGIMWENKNIRNVRTFYGHVVHVGHYRRAAAHHCDSALRETGDIGAARHGRLVLRALLPTYYRHVYARNVANVIQHGITATTKLDDVFAAEVTEVCRTSSGWLDHMWRYDNLRRGYLLSHDAMSRDMDTCDTSWPCHYARVGEANFAPDDGCLLCDAEHPCFQSRDEEACTSLDYTFPGWFPTCSYGYGEQLSSLLCGWEGCTCSRAICWYFSSDFKAGMRWISGWGCSH
ncbi:CPK1 [Symbiodinium natans]|uniref:CPK1 protein n=1 Tax=Symbiodinium natans TaxID=878477 RepID=A0A812MX61_9DINO|nr:CPK1 [Symbiodinium natans]